MATPWENNQNCGLRHKVSKVVWTSLSTLQHIHPYDLSLRGVRNGIKFERWSTARQSNPKLRSTVQKTLSWMVLQTWDCHTKQIEPANYLITIRLVRNDNFKRKNILIKLEPIILFCTIIIPARSTGWKPGIQHYSIVSLRTCHCAECGTELNLEGNYLQDNVFRSIGKAISY